MGWLAFLLSPTYRRRFLANAAQAGYAFADVRVAEHLGGHLRGLAENVGAKQVTRDAGQPFEPGDQRALHGRVAPAAMQPRSRPDLRL